MHGRDYQDVIGGVLVAAIGLFAAIYAQRYEFGSLTRMGPGFFPTTLGILLLILGLAIEVPGWRRAAGELKRPEWRTAGLVVASIVVFSVALKFLGLLPAVMTAVFLSASADRRMSLYERGCLALSVTALTILIFVTGLKMVLPLWQWNF